MLEGLSGKRVLVSGASGFIGRVLCSKLLEIGAQVTGLSRQDQKSASIDWKKCDVTDEYAVRDAIFQSKPEVVYHLASEVTGSRDKHCVSRLFHANLASTIYMMTAASDAGVLRFVQAGSQEEPDNALGDIVPSSPYAAAKWASSAYARMFHNLYGLGIVHLRVFMVYGPGQTDLNKLIPYCILESLAGRAPKIGTGARMVDWVYVDDVVRGMLLAGIVPNIEGKSFELGTGKLTSVRETVELAVELANPEVTPEFSIDSRKMESEYFAQWELSNQLLNWKPRVALQEGLRNTVQWYLSMANKKIA